MPPLPPAANVIKMEFIGDYNGTEWANILHFAYSGGTMDTTILGALAGAVKTPFVACFINDRSTGLFLRTVKATDLTSDTSPVFEEGGLTDHGTDSGAQLPANVSIVFSWHIARRYRGGHPRTYSTGVTENFLTDAGHIGDTTAASLSGLGNTFISSCNAVTESGISLTFINLSYRSGHAVRVTPVQDAIEACAVHSRLDSQRRRLGKEVT